MGVAKLSILGNAYIGAFSIATDKFILLAKGATHGEEGVLHKNLDVPVARTTVSGSDLIGIYARANSRAILLPEMLYSDELHSLKKQLHGIEIHVLKMDLNALGNNILANDKFAVLNPNFERKEAKEIGELLDVEVLQMAIGGYETVGANNILTNKGMVLNNKVEDSEVDRVKENISNVSQSTANTGSLSIGLCTVANSNGVAVGKTTTGYEMASIMEGLMLE